MTTVFDSPYFRDQFCTPAMRAVFSDTARMGAWLEVEVALARAQAGLGLIPVEAADEIARVAQVDALDMAAMKADYDVSGVAIIPLVKHLGALCSDETRRWVHWGATTQDILDTGFTLQIRDALALIEGDLDSVIRALAALATAFVVPVALVGGTYCGLNPGSPADRIVSFFSMIWISLPEFASAVFLIMIFSKALGLLPSMSGLDLQMSLASQWKAFILPALTLSLITMGYVLRMVRAGVIEVANSEYVRIARLSGVSRGTVLRKYIIRNALAPSIAIIAMNTGWMIGGLVVVETIFAFPGLGTLLLQAVVQRDVPLIQAAALCSVAAYMLLNFVADVLTILLTPQLRLD